MASVVVTVVVAVVVAVVAFVVVAVYVAFIAAVFAAASCHCCFFRFNLQSTNEEFLNKPNHLQKIMSKSPIRLTALRFELMDNAIIAEGPLGAVRI